MVRSRIIQWVSGLIVLLASSAFCGPLPDTNQTTCYDDAGNIIACPSEGQAFYGQDANYAVNPPSYTKFDEDGADLADDAGTWAMVRDNITGLIWENKTDDGSIHDKDNGYTWYDSHSQTNGGNAGTPGEGTDTEDFIKVLNSSRFGGYSDWRLPSMAELRTIADYSRTSRAINAAYFPGTGNAGYWTSDTVAGLADFGWGVHFEIGYFGYFGKSSGMKVRAVRGGSPGRSDRFIINGDGTVTDKRTGLMWQQATASETYTWQQALNYCEGSDLAGFTDWRLPNKKELSSILDLSAQNPAVNAAYFPGTVPSHYWTSTTSALKIGAFFEGAWIVNFTRGASQYIHKKVDDYHFYVRAVRGGQPIVNGNLILVSPVQGDVWTTGSRRLISWDGIGISGNVNIYLSRNGGKTYALIAGNEPNDGSFSWTVSGPSSVNCTLKIESVGAPAKSTVQGLFCIEAGRGDLDADSVVDLSDAICALKTTVGVQSAGIETGADADSDGKVGLPEAVFILQSLAGLRPGPYALTDFAGGWQLNSLASGPAEPWWQRGGLTIGPDGAFSAAFTENNGETAMVTGRVDILADGIVSLAGSPLLQGAMDMGKTIMVFTDTWTEEDSGTTQLAVITRNAAQGYSLQDLKGAWQVSSIASGPDAPWWIRGAVNIGDDGSFSGTLVEWNGQPDVVSGRFSITADGRITSPDLNPDFIARMDAGKTFASGTATWGQGAGGTTELSVWVKTGESYALSDLAGTWQVNSLATGPGAPWWERGAATIEGDGSFRASLTDSDGWTGKVSGVFNLSPGGVITMTGAPDFKGFMDAGKTVMVWTDIWSSGSPGTTEIKILTKTGQ
jgi:hypothetical protein